MRVDQISVMSGIIRRWSRSPLSASLPRQLADSIIRFYYRLNRQSFRLMVLRRRLFVQRAGPGRAHRTGAGRSVPRADANVTAMRLLHDGERQTGGQLGFTAGQSDPLRHPRVPPVRQTTVISQRFIALFFRLRHVCSFVWGPRTRLPTY